MAPARPRSLAALLTAALIWVLVAGGAAGAGETAPSPAARALVLGRSIDGTTSATLRLDPVARAAITWRGGPIMTSTGETVDVRVSDTLPVETVTPETWAEFIVTLTHGAEISALTTYIAPFDEVQGLCGARALGCYTPGQMVATAETNGETTVEEVVRHEYGHHVAFHRLNPPWRAIDWGPKHWASAASVCPRVARREAFPGDQRINYALNPGEAWAETYRLMDERKAGITTAIWPIIAPSFYPDEAALQAAERDVLEPWTSGTTSAFRRTFGRAATQVWWIPLRTPLDGDLRITAALPRGGQHEIALVAGNRRTVLRRAQWVGPRSQRLTTAVCGQRSLYIRVTPKGTPGSVRVTATAP